RFRLGFWMLVQYSLGALAFSLLPSLARDFGITSWSGAVALLAVFQFTSCVHFFRAHMSLERTGNVSRSRTLWFAGLVTMLLTPAALAWSLFGGLGADLSPLSLWCRTLSPGIPRRFCRVPAP